MKMILNLTLAATLGATAASATAILSLDFPVAPHTGVGDQLSVNLNIGGLATGGPPSLGAWIINVSYDPTIFSITNPDVTFGPNLGTLAQTIDLVDTTSVSGIVMITQTSLLSAAALDALQTTDPFLLATLEFTGLTLGTSLMGFSPTTTVSDAFGTTLVVAGNAPVAAAVVPEPSTVTLFGVGAFALGLAALRRRQRRA